MYYLFQKLCFVACIESNGCIGTILSYNDQSYMWNCDLQNDTNIDSTAGQEAWVAIAPTLEKTCSTGFDHFGNSLGCYRFGSNSMWDDSTSACATMGSNVYLVGKCKCM